MYADHRLTVSLQPPPGETMWFRVSATARECSITSDIIVLTNFHNSFSPSPWRTHTTWSIFFGWSVVWGVNYACSQAITQRVCSLRTRNRARIALYTNAIGVAGVMAIACTCGLVLFAAFGTCDPLRARRVASYDEVRLCQLFASDCPIAALGVAA